MGIIVALVLGATVGFVTASIMGTIGEEPRECSNCKRNWNSCGGSAFGPCEGWAKK